MPQLEPLPRPSHGAHCQYPGLACTASLHAREALSNQLQRRPARHFSHFSALRLGGAKELLYRTATYVSSQTQRDFPSVPPLLCLQQYLQTAAPLDG